MSRRTEQSGWSRPSSVSPKRHVKVGEAPKLPRPLPLICGVCETRARYKLGTIVLDPTVARSPDRDSLERAMGFSAFVRCRKCGAGGPWKLPDETHAHVVLLAVVALDGADDVPLVFGKMATFDRRPFRYATEGEAHLKALIDREPERAFLWVRLGNLYYHSGEPKQAEPAYERAIELDPKDIEAHSMLGAVLNDMGRRLEAVSHWHAVLEHARDATHLAEELRREVVRTTLEALIEAHIESGGRTEFLPPPSPERIRAARNEEEAVIEIRELDVGSEEGIEELCDIVLQSPRPRRGFPWRPRKQRARPRAPEPVAGSTRRETGPVRRNDRCPCGSGLKYKKCCARKRSSSLSI